MKIERLRPTVLRVTLHAYEMASLVAAARWAVEGAEGNLDPAVRDRLDDVLEGYDDALGASRKQGTDEPEGGSG